MSTITGTFSGCGDSIYLSYVCKGSSCTSLEDFPGSTCTTSDTTLTCTYGVPCASAPIYTSNFSYTQDGTQGTHLQNVDTGDCGKFIIRTDGTPSGTNSTVIEPGKEACRFNSFSSGGSNTTTSISPNGTTTGSPSTKMPILPTSYHNGTSNITTTSAPTSTPTQFTGSGTRLRTLSFTQLCLFMFAAFFLFAQTAEAYEGSPTSLTTDVALLARDSSPEPFTPGSEYQSSAALEERDLASFAKKFTELAGGWYGKKFYKLADNDPQPFGKTLNMEIQASICDWGLDFLTSELLTVDIAAECTAAVLAIGWGGGPAGELAAVLLATTSCNFFISYMMYHTNGLKQYQAVLDEICKEIVDPSTPNPCLKPGASGKVPRPDLLNDPNNCGLCGRKCDSGACDNGACVTETCTARTCETFLPCGPGSTCICASTSDGSGFCNDGAELCADLADCSDNSDCGSGEVCAIGTCCDRNVCTGASFCGGSTTTKRGLLRNGYNNATIGRRAFWNV